MNQVRGISSRNAGLIVVAVAFAVNLAALLIWNARGLYGLSGDEPHYLVISDALWSFRSFDVSAAYLKEALIPQFYSLGLAPSGVSLGSDWSWGHVVESSNGVFSWHGVLVGWFLAVPLGLFGILGAKIAMIALGAGFAWVVYLLSGQIFTSVRLRLAVSLVLVLTYPLLLASNQIFPDLPAGGLALLGLYWLIWEVKGAKARPVVTFVIAFLVALLPWVGIKYAPIAAVILIALLIVSKSKVSVVLAGAVSAALLMAFQWYAYDSPFGAFAEGVVEYGPEFWLRLSGLVLDQNQGFLFYSPLLWLGLLGIVPLFRFSRLVGVVWLVSVLLFLIPSAAHPGSYGGGSFVGRYGWGAALLFFVPTMFVLASLSRRWLIGVLGGSLVFSAWIFVTQVFIGGSYPGGPVALDLYTKATDTWLESYSIFFFPLQKLFPAFYDPAWAWTYSVNWVWAAALIGVIAISFFSLTARVLAIVAGVFAAVVVLAGVVSVPGDQRVVVEQNISAEVSGVVSGGPTWNMREGDYTWSVDYRWVGDESLGVVGKWELLETAGGTPVAAGELPATTGDVSSISQVIPFRSFQPRGFTLRVSWYGEGTFEVVSTSVSRS
ncbi:MAG: hypothetical protein K0U42_05940 [Actinomycetia bacterium]|nr:hypothetical protein [Actinomycetes bacterium]